jgi:hypothetical protein
MNMLLTTEISALRIPRHLGYGMIGVAAVLVSLARPVHAQLAAWDFTGESTAVASSVAEVFDVRLDSSNAVTRGSGAAASAANHSFRTKEFQDNGISTANSDYFQVTLSTAAGYSLSLGTVNASFAGTDSFCVAPGVTGQFAYSVDGSTFELLGSPFVMTGPGAMPQLDVAGIAALQAVPDATTITIRYYASGQTTTGGWGYYSAAAGEYGLAISGTIAISELPPLTLTASPTIFAENAAAPAAIATVTMPAALATDLVVTLACDDPTEARVPATVTLSAGTISASFEITAVDDVLADGPQTLSLTASAAGHGSATRAITVTDDGDAPPSLNPGAIAFVGFNADGTDDLAFVALSCLAATDTIIFTDKAWNGLALGKGGAFGNEEGILTWTPPLGGVAAGIVVTLNSLSNSTRSASLGSVSVAGPFNLNVDGETIYAYQGAASAPTGFLAIVATQTADATTGTGLAASHMIYLTHHADVAAYTGSRCDQASFAAYLAAISTPAQWVTEDGSGDQNANAIAPDVPFVTTGFTLAGGTSYAVWAAANANHEGVSADSDGDGVPNGVEYFMGEAAATFTPNPTVENGKISWRRSASASASYVVTTSTDLSHWEAATSGVKDLGNLIEFTLPTGPTRIFVRLEVVPSP